MVPELKTLVSHTLTNEQIIYSDDGSVLYKDISLLARNRLDCDPVGEIIVIDTKKAEDCVDLDCVTYF